MRRVVAVVLVLAAMPVSASKHVRVVLDLSKSMRTNDGGRLAILSTILLHDLARPNSTLGDSFDVIPFDLDWNWDDPNAAPPLSTQPPIKAQSGHRADFVNALRALPYDAKMTYFYPGLDAALQDLKRASASAYDIRTIVLVTDGVPQGKTRDAELNRIRQDLAPQLEQNGIRLYVLAFGTEADKNRNFFDEMVHSPKGASLGEFFVDPQGTQLLGYMLQIFSRSFGYSPDSAHPLLGTAALDLEGRTTPERVAVVVLSSIAQPPRLQLTPPANGSLNAPEGVQSAGVAGGSYSLVWALAPAAGSYVLASDAVAGSVAVLRPTRLVLEIAASPPHKQKERAIAGVPFPLRVIVRSPTGAVGDPGPVDLAFRLAGEHTATGYAWQSEPKPPASNAGRASAQGRVYDILADFPENRDSRGKTYVGYIEVEARRGEALVGSLLGAYAHAVEVHPQFALAPLPLSSYAGANALQRGEQACTQFSFQLTAGHLPHPDRPLYAVRAVLVPGDPVTVDRELRLASFTLDGQALAIEGKPGAQPGAWYKGRSLAPNELVGNHELCVRIGKPVAGNLAQPVEMNLVATLLEDPYDEFGVVRPFMLKLLISPPTFMEKWQSVLLAGLIVLSVLAFLWYLRDRPVLPADLGYAVKREDSAAPFVPRSFDPPSGLSRFLGLVAETPISATGDDRALGRVRPVKDELYQLRPARDVHVEPVERDEVIPTTRRGFATLSVHRTYRLRGKRGSHLFRMEYR